MFKSLFHASASLFAGVSLCLTRKEIRKLCLIPWLWGFFSYSVFCTGALFLNNSLYPSYSVSIPYVAGAINWVLWWIGVAVACCLASVISTITTLLLSSTLQLELARKVLADKDVFLATLNNNTATVLTETARTIKRETLKGVVCLVLLSLSLIIGFFPFGAIISFCINAWILAYLTFDLSFEALQIGARKTLGFSLKNILPYICFGTPALFALSVPFAGLFFPPFLTAGGAWFISRNPELLDRLLEIPPKTTP